MIVEEQEMRRGEIYHADLNPVFGSEQGRIPPCADHPEQPGKSAQSNSHCCGYHEQAKTKLPTHVPINGIKGLEKESFVLLEQIRTLDKGVWMISLAG